MLITLLPYVEDIKKALRRNQNKENAVQMKQYMRNQFEFFGIQSDERQRICDHYIKSHPLPEGNELRLIIRQLWDQPQREFHYFAIELLKKYKKQWMENDAELFEFLITTNSWWDTVDYLAGHVIGPWLMLYPKLVKKITKRWNRSENIWLQRMSLLFQLKYKSETNTTLLSEYIDSLRGSNEFFVQKAIGWILREYSKTDPEWVIKFVAETELKPLSMREALKVIERKKDRAF